jgi:cytochrome c-type biogenesis protein CcmH/NrfG
LAPDFAAWFNLAGCLARTGRPADAEQAYAEALKLEPDNSEARELLAELRRR